ncbi:hypothetical protein BSK59_15880 [Paenibacillus odorifer]|uniref:3D domain-containing protein n=1 Tax=Paenibacillus odorifer TaxID=189426 RepID=UPI00097B09FE|nr:3D domain-containing protein [Paenibacillus odorifer]OME54060.1 hypothetical protein BSK59_15880 [Paenibacillus odorifer]
MEKADKRVSKRHLTIPVIAVVLATILTSWSNQKEEKVEVVETKPFVMYTNPLIEKILEDMKEKAEPPKVEVKPVVEKKEPVVEKVEEKAVKVVAKAGNPVESKQSKWESYRLTHYVANCKGCSGITRSEIDVRNITEYQGYKILSVDKNKIPLGSIVEIKDGKKTYKAIAIDTGGAIKGNKLDLLVGSEKEAKKLGVKQIKLKVVRVGWQDAKKKQ